jgi:hypothetical protein
MTRIDVGMTGPTIDRAALVRALAELGFDEITAAEMALLAIHESGGDDAGADQPR